MKLSGIFLSSLILMLAGCTTAPIQTYSGPPKDASQIAVIKTRTARSGADGIYYFAAFSGYESPETGQAPVFFKSTWGPLPQELRMLPGKYLIKIMCERIPQYAILPLTLQAEAGTTYEVICEPVPGGLNMVGIKVKKI